MSSRPRRHTVLQFLDAFRAEQVHLVEGEAPFDEVDVGVVEAGEDGGPFCVNDRRLGPAEPHDFALASHPQDLVPPDGHGCRHGPGPFGRVNPRVMNNEVHRAAAVVALGPDDEASDERGRDDGNDDVRGEAGGHGASGPAPAF